MPEIGKNYCNICSRRVWIYLAVAGILLTALLVLLLLYYPRPEMAEKEFVIKARNRTFLGFDKKNEGKWKGPFSFIQGADTQFGMIDSYIEHLPDPKWDKEIVLSTKAVEIVNAMKPRPRFFVVCGDLIDAMPGLPNRSGQIKDFLKIFAKLNPDIPLVCVCGNHDLGNTPTPAAVADYTKTFGDDYFSFFVGGVMFIVLNSQFYEDRSLVPDLAEKQDEWLDRQLEEAKTGSYRHVVIFQHIPWFLNDPDEEKEYFNIVVDLRKVMLEKFHKAGVTAIFCGHYHRNAGGYYKNMELIVTSAIGAQLGKDKSGFRVVKVLEDSIRHDYYALEEVPEVVDLS